MKVVGNAERDELSSPATGGRVVGNAERDELSSPATGGKVARLQGETTGGRDRGKGEQGEIACWDVVSLVRAVASCVYWRKVWHSRLRVVR